LREADAEWRKQRSIQIESISKGISLIALPGAWKRTVRAAGRRAAPALLRRVRLSVDPRPGAISIMNTPLTWNQCLRWPKASGTQAAQFSPFEPTARLSLRLNKAGGRERDGF